MVYTDEYPILNDTEWSDNCQFPIIHKGETSTDWKNRILSKSSKLIYYRKNNHLSAANKWYTVARKMIYLWEEDLGQAETINIALYYSCDQLVYIDKRAEKVFFLNYKMAMYWYSQCTGSRYCDMSFKDYMELKDKPETELNIWIKAAI